MLFSHSAEQEQPVPFGADTEDVLQALPDLSRLNINGCISLSRLVLPECNKLTWTDCSGCALLRHIILASPALSELQAVSCQRLVVHCHPCRPVLCAPLHHSACVPNDYALMPLQKLFVLDRLISLCHSTVLG